jgi:ubiquinone/menaquinone biosynthesis C-methylase UbiE
MSEKIIDPAYKAAEMYEDFLVKSKFQYWAPRLIERAAPRAGEQVLDVACGTGIVARNVVPIVGAAGKVTGLDKSSAMLSVACRQYSTYCDEIDWWEGIAEAMPFPDQAFDLVLCQQGLQFFSDKPAAAREMLRVLRPGGRAAIAVWQAVEKQPIYLQVFSAIAAAMSVPLNALTAIFSYGDPRELAALLETAGFNSVRVESVTQDVFFVQPERFIELTFQASAAVVPVFAQLNRQTQSDAFAAVKQEMAPLIAAHTRDGFLTFPTSANIAVAQR